MITAVQKNEIPDGAAYYLQDILVDLPGIVRQRGPLQGVSGAVTFTDDIIGLASCFDPQATFQTAALHGTSSPLFGVLSADFTSKTDIPWPLGTFSTSPYTAVSSQGKVGGGSIIGLSSQYDEAAATQQLALWDGGTKADYTTGTITCARNSTTVTGVGTVWTTYASPGMYLLNSIGQYMGTVKKVVSDTSITLVNSCLQTGTAVGYKLTSLRGLNPFVVTGEITCDTTTTTVTGANTKFSQQGLATGTWDIYRASDWNYVGTVSTVTNDTSLVLAANAALSMAVERYYAVQRDGDWTVSTTSSSKKVGFLSASYAYRQWYANRAQQGDGSKLWFSDTINPEAIDVSPNTGDFIPVSSGSAKSADTPIRGIMQGFNSLLICKEDETFALIGTDETTFDVHKVWNDGALSGMSMAQWGDKVIFAGRNGIYGWDGTQVTDFTVGTLGREYRYAIKNFDPTVHRMWAAVVRDHYLLFIESVVPEITITKGQVPTAPSSWTVCINMATGAVTLLTNVDIRGSINLPVAAENDPWIAVNTASGGRLCDGNALFDSSGFDAYTCAGNVSGPQFYMESKRYPLGDPLRRKLLKQIALDYKTSTDLTIDTLIGFGNVAASSVNASAFKMTTYTWNQLAANFDTWDAVGATFATWNSINVDVWGKARYKFLKHENFIGFRLYPGAGTSSSTTIGPWQFGFKVQAPGRI